MTRHFFLLATTAILLAGQTWATDVSTCKVGEIDLSHNGVACAFYGQAGGRMIVAGGSDFPDKGPWEGGIKQYYDDIMLVFKADDGSWKASPTGSRLPVALSNGASASDGKTLWCLGGLNSEGISEVVYAVTVMDDGFAADSVTALPQGFVPNAAHFHGGTVYVHGTVDGANAFWAFHPGNGSWTELPACPDRTLSEGSSLVYQHNGREEALYLIGGRGVDDEGLYLSSSVWEYLPRHKQWVRKASMNRNGEPLTLMYSIAFPSGSANILLFGGDDGVEFLKRYKAEPVPDSLFLGHPGFDRGIYSFHTITGTWTQIGSAEGPLPSCAAGFRTGEGEYILVSGEATPGVRSGAIFGVKTSEHVSFGWVNYLIIVLYLLSMMLVGFHFSRKAKNTDEFFKGGSNIPWWAAGISIFATALSAITFLSIPAKAYMNNWGMFMYNMMIITVVPVVINLYLPFFRKLKVASAYQYLEERFSPIIRSLASLFFCLFMLARVAIVLFLPSLALNAVTGINVYTCILVMGVVTLLYCTMGGIGAVVWCDVIQGIILVGGALLTLVWLVAGVDGGLGEIVRIAVDDNKFQVLNFAFDWTQPVFWVTVLGGFSNSLLTYSSDQSVVQRYLTVKDTSSARKSLWLNGILTIPITFIFMSIGTGLYVFFKTHPGLLNVGMSNTDSIFPHFIMCELPVGVAGLLIAAIFSAAMSTLSANINSSSTVMTEDFYAKLGNVRDDGRKMRFARWSGIAVGCFGIVMALALATFDIVSLWDQFNFFVGLLTSGMGGLFLMGVISKRIGTRAALSGFICSLIVLLLCNALSPVSTTLYGFIGLVVCVATGYLFSFIFGKGR